MKNFIFINTLKNSDFVFNNFGPASDYSEIHRYIELNFYHNKTTGWSTFDSIFDINIDIDNMNEFRKHIRKLKLEKLEKLCLNYIKK